MQAGHGGCEAASVALTAGWLAGWLGYRLKRQRTVHASHLVGHCCRAGAGGNVYVDAPRRGRIYLPGSFNPLHDGHRELLEVGRAAGCWGRGRLWGRQLGAGRGADNWVAGEGPAGAGPLETGSDGPVEGARQLGAWRGVGNWVLGEGQRSP